MRSKPIIGITANFGEKGAELAEGYWRSILQCGGVPLAIPPHADEEALERTLSVVDALVLSGGGDLGDLPERDASEFYLIRRAWERQMPMLGICKGEQMIALAMGGEVYEDMATCLPHVSLLTHSQSEPRTVATHAVTWNGKLLRVNSFHHQSVSSLPDCLRACAHSADGIIEAIEATDGKAVLGVQWHPECFILAGDERGLPIFRWLTDEARLYREAQTLHDSIISLDSHCDTPMKFGTDEERLTTLPRMRDGRLDATVMVAYLPQEGDTEAEPILRAIEDYVAENADQCALATSPEEVRTLKIAGKRAIIRGIENGKALGNDLTRVNHFAKQGLAYITLCHNGDNQICDSARGTQIHGGLSPFGREVVRAMNREGLMIDLSHAAETTFWQVLDLSDAPVLCSHSSCRALCDHPRNLTDEQMRALAESGGLMQVTFYDGFLRRGGGATITDAIAHIEHAVAVMGIDHVGIGTDFDGDGGVPGVAHAGELINITCHLLRRGYSHSDIRKLWGENFLRLWSLNIQE